MIYSLELKVIIGKKRKKNFESVRKKSISVGGGILYCVVSLLLWEKLSFNLCDNFIVVDYGLSSLVVFFFYLLRCVCIIYLYYESSDWRGGVEVLVIFFLVGVGRVIFILFLILRVFGYL